MKRIIFTDPIAYDENALMLELYIKANNGLYNDELLAELLAIEPREVRKIVERLNYNKYIGITTDYQYRKINGKYVVINLSSEHRQRVINKIKFDMIASIKRYGITVNKLNDVSLMNMTLNELLELEETNE